MVRLETRQSNYSEGIFLADNLINHQDLFLLLRNAPIEHLREVFRAVRRQEMEGDQERIHRFCDFVLNRLYETDLYDRGHDTEAIARRNTEIMMQKHDLVALLLMRTTRISSCPCDIRRA